MVDAVYGSEILTYPQAFETSEFGWFCWVGHDVLTLRTDSYVECYWTQDGQYYPAQILSFDATTGEYTVSFTEYGNEVSDERGTKRKRARS